MTKEQYHYQKTDGFYDIESLADAFTFSHYNPANNVVNVFILWGQDQLQLLSKTEQQQIKDKILEINPPLKESNATINIFNGIDELAYFLLPLFSGMIRHNQRIYHELSQMSGHTWPGTLTTNPFVDENGENNTDIHTYQFGFNSKAYDMAMLAFVLDQWVSGNIPHQHEEWSNDQFITPSKIKNISNKVISANYPGALNEFSFNSSAGQLLNAMTQSTRFCDVRLLLGKSAKLTLGLKRYAAQAGWTILESDLVKGQDSLREAADKINKRNSLHPNNSKPKVTPVDLLADVVGYNVLDVLNSKKLFEMPDWQTGFNQHLQMLDRFADSFEGKLYVDSTNSKFIEYVIVPNNGGKPLRLQDNPAIDLTYPTADGKKDMLEVAREMGVDEEVLNFYDNFRGARTNPATEEAGVVQGQANALKDPRLAKAREEGRMTDKGTSLDVWVKTPTGTANNSHINVSVGGAHGEYADYQAFISRKKNIEAFKNEQKIALDTYENLVSNDPSLSDKENEKETRNMRMEFARAAKAGDTIADITGVPLKEAVWRLKDLVTVNSKSIKAKRTPSFKVIPKEFVKPIFGRNIIHIDVDSLYPTLLDWLETLERTDGYDIYGDLRVERLKLKHSLPEHKSDFTEEDWRKNAVQLLNKLLLNSATGAADANFDTNILVPNKIVSMRIIGNLLIYILSMKLAEAGGTLVSINTDGLYVAGLTEKEADPIAQEWQDYFNLSAGPEPIDRFVSKDTNNRLEVSNDKVDYAGGSSFSAWKEPSLMKSVSKPAMIDEALVNYLAHENMPLEDFDENFVRQYITDRIKNAVSPKEKEKLLLQFQWIFVGSNSKNRHYYTHDPKTNEYRAMSNIARTFITKPEYSDLKVKLLSVAKGNKTDNPVAHNIIKQDNIQLTLETGQHLITPAEIATDEIIEKVKELKKSKTNLPEFYAANKDALDNAVDTMNIDRGRYAPLALTADFKEFKSFYSNAYKATMTGTNSQILRANFVTSPRVNEEMSFFADNQGLDTLAQTDLLSQIDIDAYVHLVKGEWNLWATDHIVI